jgi:hypothetical protein
MGRPCRVCSHRQRRAIEEMINAGESDYTIGRQFNLERTGVGRHRRDHILKPAQDRITIISKGADVRQEREQLARAAASDAPSTEAIVAAAIGLQAQVAKLTAIEARLERMAVQAEEAGSPTAVAVLSGQALRGVEVGSRLAGTGAYAPQRGVEQAGTGASFSVQIVFSGSGHTETFTTSSRPLIDSADFQDRSEDRNVDHGEDRDEDDR